MQNPLKLPLTIKKLINTSKYQETIDFPKSKEYQTLNRKCKQLIGLSGFFTVSSLIFLLVKKGFLFIPFLPEWGDLLVDPIFISLSLLMSGVCAATWLMVEQRKKEKLNRTQSNIVYNMQREFTKKKFFSQMKAHPQLAAQFDVDQLEKKLDIAMKKLEQSRQKSDHFMGFVMLVLYDYSAQYEAELYHIIEPVLAFCMANYQDDINRIDCPLDETEFFFDHTKVISMNQKQN